MTLAHYGQLPAGFGDGLLAPAALVWLIVLGCYLRYAFSRRGAIVADLLDPVAAPFASLVLLTPMLLAAQGVYPHAAIAGTVLLDVFLAATVLLGSWFTGQWIYRPLELDRMHPGISCPRSPAASSPAAAPPRSANAASPRSCSASGDRWCGPTP